MKPSKTVASVIADFRREEAFYRERRGMDNISSDMENILAFLYGRLADALEALTSTERE